MRFTIRSPASSANLGPGFDAIGIALDLWNTVTIDSGGTAGEVINKGVEARLLEGQDKLTNREMTMLAESHGRRLPPFSLMAQTEIPIARGLGSSAAALVSGLVAANHLLGLGLTRNELYAEAWRMEGHGDNVGAALYGGAILAVPGDPARRRCAACARRAPGRRRRRRSAGGGGGRARDRRTPARGYRPAPS